ncbi:MAG: N-acetylmuramoyl-L-alanine amidase [Lachnospiraceae bacterium]|nr:N-acetylmuramoyl-L-alanine amidase [Lachnospiraceae bacterium]
MTALFALSFTVRANAAETVTVVIDPGHGGVSEDGSETNSGCRYHDLEEKNVNLTTAQAIYNELLQYGNVKVYLTRENDVEKTLDERVEFAKSVNADVIVSVHYNASAEHNFFGSEIFTSAYGECYATGHALAEHIMDKWVSEGNIRKDIKTRIGKKGDYYGLIRKGTEAGIPTIILEHGYLDNDRDYQRIRTEDAWRNFGILDATGIAEFYGLDKDVIRESVGPVDELKVPTDPVMPDSTEPTGVKLVIDDYNSNKGNVDFTLYAYDNESKLMYYGFRTGDVDKDTVFAELELWDGKNGKLSGSFHVQPGYEGKLTAKVYNVYQLDSLSNTVELVPDEEAPDDEEDNAVVPTEDENVDSYDTSGSESAADASEENDWVIGGSLPAVDTSAIANAIEHNTESKVQRSYTGLIIVSLIATITIVVAIVVSISTAADKRRGSKKDKKDLY